VDGQDTVLLNVRFGLRGPRGHVRIEAGRIAALAEEATEVHTPGADTVDCGGRTLLPGLHDAHVHMVQWAAARRRVDLVGTRSAREAAEVMAAAARSGRYAEDEPLIGFGFRDALWTDRPDPALLAWSESRSEPGSGGSARVTALVSNDLHTAWLGPAALRTLGLADHPTGVLREQACLDAIARLETATPQVRDRWVADAVRAAAARGVTGFLDFEYADNLADWTRRAAGGPLNSRVTAAIYAADLEQAIAEGRRTGDVVPGTGGLLTVGPLKLFVDGSLNTRTALCHEPYPGARTGQEHGVLQTPPDELARLMGRAAAHGIRSAVHAIGDRANSLALDAFEQVDGPGRIEHAQLVDRRDLPRFARPGLVLGVQPAHAVDDRDVADRYWAGRTDRAFAYAELLRAGAELEIGSDAPVSPLDPWVGIAAAVHRTGADGRAGWHPEQGIPLAAALSAAASGRSRLRPGDPADLVIPDHDPGTAPPEVLRAMPVFGTLLGGAWTHRTA
jgi:predicted amidohydrolase YtcJ